MNNAIDHKNDIISYHATQARAKNLYVLKANFILLCFNQVRIYFRFRKSALDFCYGGLSTENSVRLMKANCIWNFCETERCYWTTANCRGSVYKRYNSIREIILLATSERKTLNNEIFTRIIFVFPCRGSLTSSETSLWLHTVFDGNTRSSLLL